MREAIISLSDEEFETIGFGDLVSLCREAGLVEIKLLEDEGTRSIPQIELENELDGDRLDSLECVDNWELVGETQDSYLYILEIVPLDMPEAIGEDHDELVGVCNPTVSDRGLLLSLVGSQETIRRVIRHFEEAGATPWLEKLGKYESHRGKFESLTQRQREVLKTAYEMGFYEVPKSASVDDVAAELEIDGATVSEHLQRAERNLISDEIATLD